MTINVDTNKDAFTGDGTNAALATTFPFKAAGDLVVTKRVTATGVETTLTLSTHYTVTGGSGALGTVTVVDGATDFPSTVTWTITRATPKKQLTDYINNDNFGAETHEAALDTVTMIAIDGVEKIDRALRVAVTDANPAEIPSSTLRASKYLAFDASGDPIAADAPTDTSITTAFTQTLLDDSTAAAARTTLDAQEDVITTRGDIVRGSSGAVAERFALGASGRYLRSDGTDALWAALVAADVAAVQALPRSYLGGLVITRTSSTEFNVAKGVARCGTSSDQDLQNLKNTNAAFGKLFDNGGWDSGDGGGGVPTAAGFATAIDTWHFFGLVKQDGSAYDFGWDTSLTAANLIADAAVVTAVGASAYYRRLMSCPSNATPNFVDFTQEGDYFILLTPVLDYNDVTENISGGITVTLASVPDGIVVRALIRFAEDNGSVNDPLQLRSSMEVNVVGSITGSPLGAHLTGAAATHTGGNMEEFTNTSQAIFARKADTTVDLFIVTRGWVDRRGRDD